LKLLLILHYPPPVHGSAVVGRYIKDSKAVNETFNCRFVNLGTSASVEDIGRNSFRKLLRYLSLIWQVKKQLILFRPELCYFTPTAQGPGFYKDAVVIALVKLFGVKTIFHYHNKGVSTRQDRSFDNLLYRFVFRNSYIILLSKHLYPDIQKYIPESRVFYCPNGIPYGKGERRKAKGESWQSAVGSQEQKTLNLELGILNQKQGTRNNRHTEILFLSHLIRSKGVLVLIEVCALLKERGVNFHCTIAGGDAELIRENVEKIVKTKNLETFISVVGSKNGEEKMQLFESADIFVHPSYNDCMPLILLEAMQSSLPVVSTFEGAIPDMVEDGVSGFLVPQKDAAAVADKLEILINTPELRKKMGAAGRARYEQQFTLERFEGRMVEILKEVGSK